MAKTIWKGAISFGLVTIPVQIINATKREELKFKMLRKRKGYSIARMIRFETVHVAVVW